MAVTDLTDSLPWWARGAAGGPGPTGTPSAAPMGAGGQPGAGDSASWLQYLSQMFGISPQQAAMMTQGGANPADMPSANATPMEADTADHGTGDNPPVTPFAIPPRPPMTNFGNPAPTNGPGPGNVGPVNLNTANVPQPPQPSAGPPVGAGMLDQSGVQRGPMGVLRTQPGASAPVGAGLPNQSGVARNPAGVLTPGAPAGTGPAPAPVPGPLASGGAGGVGATSNPRFGTTQYQVPNSTRNAPIMTTLNLGGLFGAGQPAAPLAAAPGARPQVAGPLAGGMVPSTYPGDNWDIDAQGNVVPNYGSTTGPLQRPPKSSVARARILAPNYYG